MADAFANHAPSISGPYTVAAAIDLSSTDADLSSQPTRAINVTVAGNLKVDMLGSGTGVTLAVPVGEIRIRATKVYKIGTTATGLVALS